MNDEPGHALAAELILTLRQHGAADGAFEKIVAETDVRGFVPLGHRDAVRADRWLPLECGQSLPPPNVTVRLVQAVGATASHSVLEIGTGSGFQTALLARGARKVTSVERYRTLSQAALRRLTTGGIGNAVLLVRDGSVAHRDGVVYDRIVIDSAFEQVPRHYIDMLAPGGVLVCAVGPADGEQNLLRLTKIGARFERETLFPVRFNPLEKGLATAL